jgi:hypothetical protein
LYIFHGEILLTQTPNIAHPGAFLTRCEVWSQPLRAHAVGKLNQDKLWALSEKLVEEKFEHARLDWCLWRTADTKFRAREKIKACHQADDKEIRCMIGSDSTAIAGTLNRPSHVVGTPSAFYSTGSQLVFTTFSKQSTQLTQFKG